MFNVGGGELLVIMALALIVFGPDKLPEIARQAGSFLSEFRRISEGFQNEVREAMDLGSAAPSATQAVAPMVPKDRPSASLSRPRDPDPSPGVGAGPGDGSWRTSAAGPSDSFR